MGRATRTLARVPLFRSLDADVIAQLDARCTWRQVAANQLLLELSDAGTEVCFLTSGSVRALINSAPEHHVILSDLNPGDFFGEMAAIDGSPRSASMVALTQATVACMPATVFRDVLHRHPSVAEQLLLVLVRRIRRLTQRVHEFSSLHVKHRICAELIRRSRSDPSDMRQAIVSPPPTHAEIAAHVSTRRETVAREFKTLERSGLLARKRGALVLTNVHGLMEMLQAAQMRA